MLIHKILLSYLTVKYTLWGTAQSMRKTMGLKCPSSIGTCTKSTSQYFSNFLSSYRTSNKWGLPHNIWSALFHGICLSMWYSLPFYQAGNLSPAHPFGVFQPFCLWTISRTLFNSSQLRPTDGIFTCSWGYRRRRCPDRRQSGQHPSDCS